MIRKLSWLVAIVLLALAAYCGGIGWLAVQRPQADGDGG
jgi:hypothetical protein